MMNTVTFEERLLPMLIEAAEERRPKRGRRRKAGLALVIAATVGLLASLVLPATGRGDVVRVSAADAVRDPRSVERTLADAGIDATVEVVPVSPYWKVLDRTWWWLHLDGPSELSQPDFALLYAQVGDGLEGLSASQIDGGREVGHRPFIEVPRGLGSHITLFAAKVVPEGAPNADGYDFSNELSPIGTFYCLGLDPSDPVAVVDRLRSLGYDVIWRVETESNGTEQTQSAQPPAGTVITWAWLRGPTTVDVRLMAAGDAASRYQHAEGTYPPGADVPWAQSCP